MWLRTLSTFLWEHEVSVTAVSKTVPGIDSTAGPKERTRHDHDNQPLLKTKTVCCGDILPGGRVPN